MQAVWVIAFLILTFLTAKWKIARIRRSANRLKSFGERIGLIIAHPDDECMFFSPTLVENSDADWFVLCLSKGNAYGLGSIREKELTASCALSGIRSDRVQIIDDPALKDGMNEQWDARVVAGYVKQFVNHYNLQQIVSFDHAGVSNHPNHIACFTALRSLSTRIGVPVWILQSRPFISKYLAFAAVFTQGPKPSGTALQYAVPHPVTSFRCMLMHASQFVWYRVLFVVASSFSYVNVLERLC